MSFPLPLEPQFEITCEAAGWYLSLSSRHHGALLWGGPFRRREDAQHLLRWLLASAALETRLIPADREQWIEGPTQAIALDRLEGARVEAVRVQGGHRLAVFHLGTRILISAELRSRIDIRGLFSWLGTDGGQIDVLYSEPETIEPINEVNAESWLARMERRIQEERREQPDLVELVHDAEWDRRFDLTIGVPTTANSVTIGAGDEVQVSCPWCYTEFVTTGPELPTIALKCSGCGWFVMPVELVLASGGIWIADPYGGCNARSFRLADGGFAAFCSCSRRWHGPRRDTDGDATGDAQAHRDRVPDESNVEDAPDTSHETG